MQASEKLLEKELSHHLKIDKRRVYFISKLIIGLLKICSVSYVSLSKVVNSEKKKQQIIKDSKDSLSYLIFPQNDMCK